MAEDKIRISWDEVQNPEIDERIRQQSVQTHAAQHYQRQGGGSGVAGLAVTSVRKGSGGFWRNTLVYMTLFGLAGGLLAWLLGEGVLYAQRATIQSAIQKADGRLKQLEKELDQSVFDGRYPLENAKAKYKASLDQEQASVSRMEWFFWIAFYGLCGGILAAFLGVGEPLMEGNWAMSAFRGSLGLFTGLLGGILVALFIDALYRAMGGGKPDTPLAVQILARAIGWTIIGMFLSISAGLVLRSIKKGVCGLAGGLLGGLIGGCLFDPIFKMTNSDMVSRLVSIVAIGGLGGLATGVLENAAKTGWLRVLRGVIAGKQFILYRNPTRIGSSPQCEIYLFKDPSIAPSHAALHVVGGGFELEDLHSGMPTYVNGRSIGRQCLRNGDQVQIGSTLFLFQERNRQQ